MKATLMLKFQEYVISEGINNKDGNKIDGQRGGKEDGMIKTNGSVYINVKGI